MAGYVMDIVTRKYIYVLHFSTILILICNTLSCYINLRDIIIYFIYLFLDLYQSVIEYNNVI